ncbi:gated mechanosensitive channel [Calocera viscosa TUFC12733]|uniref:Gated mechanosensitive channel n=1 Tax=Calocera viscosa (strain TUFC12733) TaxID=1330018 RepID=A0A167Q3C5_CALVF|nr:gated mechanosensitive channel [Calocera viscosa TUFC12733]
MPDNPVRMNTDQWDETRDQLLEGQQKIITRVRSAWQGFKDFALRDNVLEIAVGLMLGAAFTLVVTSLISDVILPPLSLLPFMGKNLEEKFLVLKHGATHVRYETLKQAADDGAVTMAWGLFLNNLFHFLGLGLALYLLAQFYGWVSKDSIIKHTVRCAYCRKEISAKAKRCYLCTSWLDGREDYPRTALGT